MVVPKFNTQTALNAGALGYLRSSLGVAVGGEGCAVSAGVLTVDVCFAKRSVNILNCVR